MRPGRPPRRGHRCRGCRRRVWPGAWRRRAPARRACGSHELSGESGADREQCAKVALAQRLLGFGVELRRPFVEVTGGPSAAPGAAIAHGQQAHPLRGLAYGGTKFGAAGRWLVLGHRLQDAVSLVAGLVEEQRAETERRRQGGVPGGPQRRRKDRQVQVAVRIPSLGRGARSHHSDQLGPGLRKPLCCLSACLPQVLEDRVAPRQLAGEQRRPGTQGSSDDHDQASCRSATQIMLRQPAETERGAARG